MQNELKHQQLFQKRAHCPKLEGQQVDTENPTLASARIPGRAGKLTHCSAASCGKAESFKLQREGSHTCQCDLQELYQSSQGKLQKTSFGPQAGAEESASMIS